MSIETIGYTQDATPVAISALTERCRHEGMNIVVLRDFENLCCSSDAFMIVKDGVIEDEDAIAGWKIDSPFADRISFAFETRNTTALCCYATCDEWEVERKIRHKMGGATLGDWMDGALFSLKKAYINKYRFSEGRSAPLGLFGIEVWNEPEKFNDKWEGDEPYGDWYLSNRRKAMTRYYMRLAMGRSDQSAELSTCVMQQIMSLRGGVLESVGNGCELYDPSKGPKAIMATWPESV